MALREAVCCCRCVWEQPGRAGVRVADPQGHPAALRVPADGAQEDHPVWPQRHGQDLPGQQAVRVPGAQGGQGAGRGHHRHLQRGPQIQQGERAQTRPRAEAVPRHCELCCTCKAPWLSWGKQCSKASRFTWLGVWNSRLAGVYLNT